MEKKKRDERSEADKKNWLRKALQRSDLVKPGIGASSITQWIHA